MQPTKLGNTFVIRTQPSQQPHQLHIAPALAFQSPRGTNLLQIPVQIKLQQISRIVSRPPCLGRFCPHKSQPLHVDPVDQCVNHPAKMITRNQFLQAPRKQYPLRPLISFDESHPGPLHRIHQPTLSASSFVTASNRKGWGSLILSDSKGGPTRRSNELGNNSPRLELTILRAKMEMSCDEATQQPSATRIWTHV